jgi:hypothetical protein
MVQSLTVLILSPAPVLATLLKWSATCAGSSSERVPFPYSWAFWLKFRKKKCVCSGQVMGERVAGLLAAVRDGAGLGG